MYIKRIFSVFMGVTACVTSLGAAPMFSQYGQIQNVQNYSTNPLYTPNSSYRYNMPSPVFSTGPTVSTSDCQYTVTDLINNYCLGLNNCAGLDANDIRPSIMLQLSYMQNGNYSTACAGYIDELFNKYISQHPNTKTVSVPMQSDTASVPQSTIANPYQNNAPTWAQDMQKRQQELQNLRKPDDNMYTQGVLYSFPSSSADLSREEKIANLTHGYEPFKDARAYREMDIQRDETLVNVTPVDVCAMAIGATTVDNDMDRIYSFYDDDSVKASLMSYVNEPYTWGVAFPYGIIIGRTVHIGYTRGVGVVFNNTQIYVFDAVCGCQVVKYYANDGRVYNNSKPIGAFELPDGRKQLTGGAFPGIQLYPVRRRSDETDEDFSARVDEAMIEASDYANEDYYRRCSGMCINVLVRDGGFRSDAFDDIIPHTDPATCKPDTEYVLHFDIGEDNPGYFEHYKENNVDLAKRISDEFLYGFSGTNFSSAHNCSLDHNGNLSGMTRDKSDCDINLHQESPVPGSWKTVFSYGEWIGYSDCKDNGQCSCAYGSLGVLPEYEHTVSLAYNTSLPLTQVPLMTFGSVDACKEKCSEQCAFAVGQAGNASVEFRKKLIPKDKILQLIDNR